mmetsp:Transcript_28993/g.32043  ORF Transcript_28993/g.32043 Transcript_28993/m.32043 type:complete len:117 (-) Transcript_28993:438-788(-)|eukprot:CAMPEP_0194144786 /NCGR_PEP_ID=MMETSP0152-20130528/13797_1 /TAXON_ID=1049557 /ORGANISM="Thalassiothrix antarctica, Strain L6-D1" /LENGTH=116 /DNA_ID=CAMNT_0038844787 /DNA_START=929 /DNA_END=1279 /DNA_ORIENTATION=-
MLVFAGERKNGEVLTGTCVEDGARIVDGRVDLERNKLALAVVDGGFDMEEIICVDGECNWVENNVLGDNEFGEVAFRNDVLVNNTFGADLFGDFTPGKDTFGDIALGGDVITELVF